MLSGMIQLSVCTFYYIVVDTVSQSRSLMDVYVIVRLEEEDNLFCHVLMNLFKANSFLLRSNDFLDLTLMSLKEKEIKVCFSGRT